MGGNGDIAVIFSMGNTLFLSRYYSIVVATYGSSIHYTNSNKESKDRLGGVCPFFASNGKLSAEYDHREYSVIYNGSQSFYDLNFRSENYSKEY